MPSLEYTLSMAITGTTGSRKHVKQVNEEIYRWRAFLHIFLGHAKKCAPCTTKDEKLKS